MGREDTTMVDTLKVDTLRVDTLEARVEAALIAYWRGDSVVFENDTRVLRFMVGPKDTAVLFKVLIIWNPTEWNEADPTTIRFPKPVSWRLKIRSDGYVVLNTSKILLEPEDVINDIININGIPISVSIAANRPDTSADIQIHIPYLEAVPIGGWVKKPEVLLCGKKKGEIWPILLNRGREEIFIPQNVPRRVVGRLIVRPRRIPLKQVSLRRPYKYITVRLIWEINERKFVIDTKTFKIPIKRVIHGDTLAAFLEECGHYTFELLPGGRIEGSTVGNSYYCTSPCKGVGSTWSNPGGRACRCELSP